MHKNDEWGLLSLFQMTILNFNTVYINSYNQYKHTHFWVLIFSIGIEVLIPPASLRTTGLERTVQIYSGMSRGKENRLSLTLGRIKR